MFSILNFLLGFLCLGLLARATPPPTPPGLVDIGYAKHVPTSTYKTPSGRSILVYKNIRFGNPPVGDLRFRLPNTSLPSVSGIQDGKVADKHSTNCISSMPGAAPFPPYNGTTWGSEDCLFLDVWVPQDVKPGDNVPVLHWFASSAYAFGSKEMFVSPTALFDVMADNRKFIFVVNNYRLGVSGWTYLPGEDLVANLGMHDCHAAAQWTSKHIRTFGGNPDQITVVGEGAGAGIISLLTVLNGGEGILPFQQALISSPDIPPRRHPINQQKNLFKEILDGANCTSLECLRRVPEATIQHVNDELINSATSDAGGGVFGPAPGFGPVPDGVFIPDTPLALYQQGRYHKKLRVLVVEGVVNEGFGLSQDKRLPEYFPNMVRQIFSNATNETIAEIQSLYNMTGNADSTWDWTTDVVFGCNAINVAEAYKKRNLGNIYLHVVFKKRALGNIYSVSLENNWGGLSFNPDSPTTVPTKDSDAESALKNLLDFLYGKEFAWPAYTGGGSGANITAAVSENSALSTALQGRCALINQMVLNPDIGV